MTTINKYNNLVDLIYFVIKNYPNKNELSKARLTKIIYLLDWKYTLDYWKQITSIDWYFDSYWPYVIDVVKTTESTSLFKMKHYLNYFNNIWTIIEINDDNYEPNISDDIKEIYDFIVNKTKKMNFNDFINFVYSTYPVQVSKRYTNMNLLELAQEYKKN